MEKYYHLLLIEGKIELFLVLLLWNLFRLD